MEAERAAGDRGIESIYPRLADAVNQRDLDALDELIAPDIINHGSDPNDPPGAERFKRSFRSLIATCPDLRVTVEQQVAQGDWVAVRWTDRGTDTGGFWGRPPTGKEVLLTGIDLIRVEGGRIAERWGESDLLFVLQELGIVPADLRGNGADGHGERAGA